MGEPTLFVETQPDGSQARIDKNSPAELKIALFRSLFSGRDDVYALRWESARTGKTEGCGFESLRARELAWTLRWTAWRRATRAYPSGTKPGSRPRAHEGRPPRPKSRSDLDP